MEDLPVTTPDYSTQKLPTEASLTAAFLSIIMVNTIQQAIQRGEFVKDTHSIYTTSLFGFSLLYFKIEYSYFNFSIISAAESEIFMVYFIIVSFDAAAFQLTTLTLMDSKL